MLNSSIYIFGSFDNGYSQYPDNYSKEIFQTFHIQAKAKAQILIHRDRDLMYYGYIRRLDKSSQYIGFCVLLNGLMFSNISTLFNVFENAIAALVSRGDIIAFNDHGEIVSTTGSLAGKQNEVSNITSIIKNGIDGMKANTEALPPVSYNVSITSTKTFKDTDPAAETKQASCKYAYTTILKERDYDSANTRSYYSTLKRLCTERDELREKLGSKNNEIIKLKVKNRNLSWVAILGVIVVIFGAILWDKVLFPSEVTHYETGEFIYYGPMKDNKPHGVGVAIYPTDDPDGRRYYIGNFSYGERQDSTAILFYQDGDYYYGAMEGDKWTNGLFYRRSDGTYFQGTFKDNEPFNGEWFDHVKKYNSVEGKVVY